jgi:hypothetical protein
MVIEPLPIKRKSVCYEVPQMRDKELPVSRKDLPPSQEEMEFVTETGLLTLSTAFGQEFVMELFQVMSGHALLRERRTTLLQFETIASAAPSADEASLEMLMNSRMVRFNDIIRRCLLHHPLLKSTASVQLMCFLADVSAIPGCSCEGRVEKLYQEGLFRVFVPASIVPQMVANGDNRFEVTIEEAAKRLNESIESWYKELLIEMFELSPKAKTPALPRGGKVTLGKWMEHCRKLWQSTGGPTAILDQDLLQIRNVFSHENLDIDVKTETIASPLNAKLRLDREGFARFLHEMYMRECGLWMALSAYKRRKTQ